MGRLILQEKNLCYFGLFFDDLISIFTYIHLHMKESRDATQLSRPLVHRCTCALTMYILAIALSSYFTFI